MPVPYYYDHRPQAPIGSTCFTKVSLRFEPKLVADIFAGPYYTIFHKNGECTVVLWTGDEWFEMRRR